MKKKDDIQLKGRLKLYMYWPIYVSIVLVAMCIWIYIIDHVAGLITSAFVLIYMIIVGYLYLYLKSKIVMDLVEFAAQYGIVQNKMLKELMIPYAVLTSNGKILWMNDNFADVLHIKESDNIYLSRLMPELNRNTFPKNQDEKVSIEVFFEDREFTATMSRVSIFGFNESEKLMDIPKENEFFVEVYLRDDTEKNRYIRENEDQRMVVGLLYIDNYDEVIENVEEVRQSLLVALVERRISKYVSKGHGISKRLESDKYLILVQKKFFREMIADKFSLLEDVKSINVGNDIPVTLSIGLGISKDSFALAYSYARVAIDMALARGGDQAVIKNTTGITYYGGKREQISKNTRVKARVKAEALREFITVKDDIFVMGHKLPDVDALGAAIGIYRACEALGKRAHIVVNEVSASLKPLYDCYMNNPDYPADMFMKSQEALARADERSLVVVVDTNRPHLLDCPELLKKTRTIVVLDHHRQNSDKINNALLSYVEPYASSACEMVSEILQYIVDDIKIPKLEASSIYAGIMIDTNNFVNRTGVRTFEAAAFLRRSGADITMIRKLLRDDMDAFRAKADIISTAEVYKDKYAIAVGQDLQVPSPTILGAQAADELLDINNIKASFVLTTYNNKIYVSARSIDEVNVQVLMEQLGGGGHINASGAQFDHTDLDEAVRTLKNIIDDMSKEGEL